MPFCTTNDGQQRYGYYDISYILLNCKSRGDILSHDMVTVVQLVGLIIRLGWPIYRSRCEKNYNSLITRFEKAFPIV